MPARLRSTPALITKNGVISTTTFGTGNAGSIDLRTTGPIKIIGTNTADTETGIFSVAAPGSTGNAGSVTVTAPQISVAAEAQIASTTFGPGDAGSVEVTVSGALSIGGGGQITTSTSGAGNAGIVIVNAGSIAIDGAAAPVGSTGIFSGAQPDATGNAGDIGITAGTLALTGGGQISIKTSGSGTAGNLVVEVAGALSIDGKHSQIDSDTAGSGNAGQVTASARSLSLTNAGSITSSTDGAGNAGSVTVTVAGLVVDGFVDNLVSGIGTVANPGWAA